MKKIFLTIVAAVMSLSTFATVTVTIPNVTIVSGGSATVAVTLQGDENLDSYSIDFHLPAGFTATGISKGEIANDGTPVQATGTYEGVAGTTRISTFSPTATPFTATSGVVAYLTIQDDGTTNAVNSVSSATFNNIVLSLAGSEITPAGGSFNITVVGYVTLDEDQTFTPFAISGKDVKLIRPFTANQFATICLPFNVTANAAQAAFGSGVEVYQFNGVDYDDSEESLELNFTKRTQTGTSNLILNATPYIIKPTTSISTDYTFASVNVTATAAKTVSKEESNSTGESIGFVGNYTSGKTIPADNMYLMSDGKLYVSTGGTKIKSTRAYFDTAAFFSAVGGASVKENSNISLDGVLTSIDALDADGITTDGWYDLNGRKLGAKPAAKGIYINNGKKVVVK